MPVRLGLVVWLLGRLLGKHDQRERLDQLRSDLCDVDGRHDEVDDFGHVHGRLDDSGSSSTTADCGTPSGSYSGTCTGCSLSNDCEYSCSCANDDNASTTSSVELPCDAGLANCNGLLNCEDVPGGPYLASCRGCAVNGGGCELDCTCPAGGFAPMASSLPLPCPAGIANCGGLLTCETLPDGGDYLQSCTGCSVTNCALSCAGCQGASGTPAPLPLPCDGGILDCSGVLSCDNPELGSCPSDCVETSLDATGPNSCTITCSCMVIGGLGGNVNSTVPYPCAPGYVQCAGYVVECGSCN